MDKMRILTQLQLTIDALTQVVYWLKTDDAEPKTKLPDTRMCISLNRNEDDTDMCNGSMTRVTYDSKGVPTGDPDGKFYLCQKCGHVEAV